MQRLKKIFGLQSTPPRSADPAVNVNCTEFEVNNWVISKFITDTLVPIVGVHPFPLTELVLMVSAVCRLKPDCIIEWGTHIGKSARIFHETSKHFELDAKIHSVDLPNETTHREHPGLQRGMLVQGLPDVTLHQGDGLNMCLELHNRMGKPAKTLVFIDGDHDYDSVRRDLTGVMTSMPDANILLHDTFFQSAESGYNVGPHQAIIEAFSSAPNRYRRLSTDTGLPGMTLLYH